MTYDFFLSHSTRLDSRANLFVRLVAKCLEERGCKVFLDLHALASGQPLDSTIRAAIEASRVGVFMYSAVSAESKWVEYELCLMFKQKVKTSMTIWLLCTSPVETVPDWVRPEDVLSADDYRRPEVAADELVRRFKRLHS